MKSYQGDWNIYLCIEWRNWYINTKKKEEEETIKKVIYKNTENYFYILVSDMKDYNQLFNNSFKWIYVLFIHI